MPTASGVPSASAPSVTTNEPWISGRMPKLPSVGAQTVAEQEVAEPDFGDDRPRLPAHEDEDERDGEHGDERAGEEECREQPLLDVGLPRDELQLAAALRVPFGVAHLLTSLGDRDEAGVDDDALLDLVGEHEVDVTPWPARSARPS